MKKLFIVAPLILALSACGTISSFKSSGVSKDDHGTKTFSNEVNVPEWYTNSPKKDDKGIYAVGSEYSKDFQFSVDKAMLSAKRELATQFSSYTSSMMKDFAMEAGMANSDVVRSDIERTTKLIAAKVNLVGVQRTNFKIVHDGQGYRTFVQLRYDSEVSNKIMLSEINKNAALYAKFRASKSFNELERENALIDNQRVQELRAMQGN